VGERQGEVRALRVCDDGEATDDVATTQIRYQTTDKRREFTPVRATD